VSGGPFPLRRSAALVARYAGMWIAIAAALLFVPGLGSVHLFDRDEINFAEIAREMLVTGQWSQPSVGFRPFYEKPPLFMWLQAVSMTVFGVGEFAARLPNALCGALTLVALYRIGAGVRGRAFGLLWVLAYVGSLLPHVYFRSGIIDPWFNLFIFLGLGSLIRCAREPSSSHAALGGLFLGLATLTKGPVGVLIPGVCAAVYWASRRFRFPIAPRHLLIVVAAAAATILPWVAVDLVRNGPDFMLEMVRRHVKLLAGEKTVHTGFIGYHVVVLLLGCFPASVFAVQEMLEPPGGDARQRDFRRWMLILFWIVLVAFSLVQTKVVHYSSLCYFPLTYLAALQLERIVVGREPFGWTRWAVGVGGSILAAAVIAAPFVMMHRDAIAPLFAGSPFAHASLMAPVAWTGVGALAGVWLLAVLGVAHLLHARRAFAQSAIVLFAGTGMFVPLALVFFAGNVEAHTQRAAVEFFQARRGERCYLLTRSYRSFAHWFYARTTEAEPEDNVLVRGPIDRPVYLVTRITAIKAFEAVGTFREIDRRNGFVFWRRDP
jgi:4-amino-4-deoxy-L-arabinose transferase-like glycosyltransferase